MRCRDEASRSYAGPLPAAIAAAVNCGVAPLYEEDPSDKKGKRFVGSVIWRTEMWRAGTGSGFDPAIRADIEIPERRITISLLILRDLNQAQQATSHSIEIIFDLPSDLPFGFIQNVPGVLMKQGEQMRGSPLRGATTKLTSEYFLIGLSAVEKDRQRNVQLMREHGWFDIAIVYNNGRRATLTIEKGTSGERVFQEAFKIWDGPSPGQPADISVPKGVQTLPLQSAPSGEYVVQVSAQKTEDEARASYQLLQQKYASVLSGRDPIIRRAELGQSGTWYRVHVGSFATAEQADRVLQQSEGRGRPVHRAEELSRISSSRARCCARNGSLRSSSSPIGPIPTSASSKFLQHDTDQGSRWPAGQDPVAIRVLIASFIAFSMSLIWSASISLICSASISSIRSSSAEPSSRTLRSSRLYLICFQTFLAVRSALLLMRPPPVMSLRHASLALFAPTSRTPRARSPYGSNCLVEASGSHRSLAWQQASQRSLRPIPAQKQDERGVTIASAGLPVRAGPVAECDGVRTRHRLSCLVRYPPVRSPRGGSRYSAMIIHNSETNAPSVMTSAATPSA